MNIDDKLIQDAMIKNIAERVGSHHYNTELDKTVNAAIAAKTADIRRILDNAIASCINDEAFVEQIQSAVRTKMANTLIQRFGGEIEKQVNVLKSDPTTRARITIAIEQIVAQKGAA